MQRTDRMKTVGPFQTTISLAPTTGWALSSALMPFFLISGGGKS